MWIRVIMNIFGDTFSNVCHTVSTLTKKLTQNELFFNCGKHFKSSICRYLIWQEPKICEPSLNQKRTKNNIATYLPEHMKVGKSCQIIHLRIEDRNTFSQLWKIHFYRSFFFSYFSSRSFSFHFRKVRSSRSASILFRENDVLRVDWMAWSFVKWISIRTVNSIIRQERLNLGL